MKNNFFKMNYSSYRLLANSCGNLLISDKLRRERQFLQHGVINVFHHSISVALVSIYISKLFNLNVDQTSLIRGALLHDYFLYDWHHKDCSHRWHGYTHAKRALDNAEKDFSLNDIEKDIIKKHMFPLNIAPPKCKESYIVCISDKLVAIHEAIFRRIV